MQPKVKGIGLYYIEYFTFYVYVLAVHETMTKEEPSKTRKELKMKEKELSKTKEGITEQIIESTGESISINISESTDKAKIML